MASVYVLNGIFTTGLAQQEANTLQTDCFTIGTVGDAPASNYPVYTLYDLSKGSKPKTLAALESTLGVKTATTTLPAGITSTSMFVVVVGQSTTSTSPSSTSQ
jgi:hypothetical protein